MTIRQMEFNTGEETAIQPTVLDPSAPTDFVTKGFGDVNYMQGGRAVADVAELKAVSETNRHDNDIRLVDSLDELYKFDSASSETGDDYTVITPTSGTGRWHLISASGSGSGSGGINHITGDSNNAELTVGDWTVVGSGITFTRNITTPQRGSADFEYAKASGDQSGTYATCPFIVPIADRRKVHGIYFDCDAEDAAYVSEDVQVVIYDTDTSTEITPYSPLNAYKLPNGMYRFRAGYAPSNTSSANYELRIKQVGTTSAAYTLRFDDFTVTPGQVQMGFDGIWKTYDISAELNKSTGGTTNLAEAQPYKDTEGNWRVRLNIVIASASAGTNHDLTINGLQWSTALQSGSASGDSAGGYSQTSTASTDPAGLVIRYSAAQTGVRASGDFALASKPTWANFDPIATVYPTTDDLAVTPWAAYTPTTQGLGTITSRLQWRYNFDSIEIVGDFTSGTPTAVEAQLGLPNSETISFKSSTDTIVVGRGGRAAATTRDSQALLATSGDSFLNFGYAIDNDAGDNITTPQTGDNVTSVGERYTIFASVPIDRNAGQIPPVGLELASDTQYGITKQQKLLTDSRASGSALALTTSTAANVTASGLTLTPGTWELKARVGYSGTATSVGTIILGATTSSATTPAVADRDIGRQVSHNLSAANLNFAFYSRTVTVTSDTTYYMVTFQTFSGGTCNVFGDFVANRIIE